MTEEILIQFLSINSILLSIPRKVPAVKWFVTLKQSGNFTTVFFEDSLFSIPTQFYRDTSINVFLDKRNAIELVKVWLIITVAEE